MNLTFAVISTLVKSHIEEKCQIEKIIVMKHYQNKLF